MDHQLALEQTLEVTPLTDHTVWWKNFEESILVDAHNHTINFVHVQMYLFYGFKFCCELIIHENRIPQKFSCYVVCYYYLQENATTSCFCTKFCDDGYKCTSCLLDINKAFKTYHTGIEAVGMTFYACRATKLEWNGAVSTLQLILHADEVLWEVSLGDSKTNHRIITRALQSTYPARCICMYLRAAGAASIYIDCVC